MAGAAFTLECFVPAYDGVWFRKAGTKFTDFIQLWRYYLHSNTTRSRTRSMSKMPMHDGSEMIELYLDRLESWFDLEGHKSQKRKNCDTFSRFYRPPCSCRLSRPREHPFPYEQMKKVLKQAFAREEAARVRELTANVTLGNR